MAPELFNNESVSEKCDVYSFAVLLWEAYSGKKPYEGLEPVHVLLKMSHQASQQHHCGGYLAWIAMSRIATVPPCLKRVQKTPSLHCHASPLYP